MSSAPAELDNLRVNAIHLRLPDLSGLCSAISQLSGDPDAVVIADAPSGAKGAQGPGVFKAGVIAKFSSAIKVHGWFGGK